MISLARKEVGSSGSTMLVGTGNGSETLNQRCWSEAATIIGNHETPNIVIDATVIVHILDIDEDDERG